LAESAPAPPGDGPDGGRLSLGFTAAGHAYAHLFMLLYPTVVLALGPAFDRPYGELLALATPAYVLFGAGALPAGWLGDRWSAFGMLVVFFVGTGAAAVATGFATDPVSLALGLGAIGLFASIYHPVGTAWVVRHAARRTRALGFNGMCGNFGVALAALVAGALTELAGWRAAFIVPGLISIATGIAFFAVVRAGAVDADTAERVAHIPRGRGETRRAIAVLLVAAVLGGLVFQATTVGLPKLFDDRLGALAQGTLGVGAMVSVVYGIAGFAQIIVGRLAERRRLKPLYLALYALQAPLLLLAGFIAGAPLLAVCIAFVFVNVGVLPVGDGLLARFTPPRWRATVYGVKFVAALGVAALGVPLVALTRDATGDFTLLFVVLAALAASVVAAASFLPNDDAPATTPDKAA